MKCPHCNQEHPNNFQFCPIKGLPISFMKACNNPNCSNYGEQILPVDARFCPVCGQHLEEENNISDKLEFMVNGVSFTMIRVEHGEFMMGATEEQKCPSDNEAPVHKVKLTNDYYIGETPVTQALWRAVMHDNPSSFGEGGLGSYECYWEHLPVDSISWHDCQEFIKALNSITGKRFRIPTEAEWEYAARGGKKSNGYLHSGSDEINDVAWFHGNSNNETHPVKTKKSNELGIYDMNGNVTEWCIDGFNYYNRNTETDPIGCYNHGLRICRGGCWNSFDFACRLSARDCSIANFNTYYRGLRLILSDINYDEYFLEF